MYDFKNLRHRTLGVMATLAAAASCAVFAPAGAQAATAAARPAVVHPNDGWGETATGTNLFYQATPADGYYSTISSGNWLDVHCWLDGASYHGTNRWFKVNYYGTYYYASAGDISPQPVVGSC